MRRLLIIFSSLLICTSAFSGVQKVSPLYQQLREVIDSVAIYDDIKQQHIQEIKNKYNASTRLTDRQRLCQQLFEAYSKFCYDSAIVYLNRNMDLAIQANDDDRIMEMKLRKAKYFASAGSFQEAAHIIMNIKEEDVPESMLSLYYEANRAFYVEAGVNMHDEGMRNDFLSKSGFYRRRLTEILDSTSVECLKLIESRHRTLGETEQALHYNDLQLSQVREGTPQFSETAFFRSCIYQDTGDREMQIEWLLRSAIADIRNSIKDQASLWTLANLLAEDGDTEWSYLLIRTSQDGVRFYNAPLRYLQSVNILSMIDHNYQLMTDKQNTQLRWFVWLVSLLALALLCSVIFIYRQMTRLKVARKQLHQANADLKNLNRQLNSTVESLNLSNEKLMDSNTIKDVYIGRFLSQCSEYMKKMESFRSTVLKKEKSGQLEEYLSKTKMREMKAKEVAEFMSDFDKAFLHIVPTFIEEFNELLRPEARIVPTDSSSLTTELRIFALIRLGITDSSKIAEFLNYSVQTIYNYRSSVKKNALGSRDDFEEDVKKIGL